MKLVYNARINHLSLIYTKTNVKEEYSNIPRKGFIEYLKSGHKDLYSIKDYCKDAKYDFNNREMEISAVGEKPLQRETDGVVPCVDDYLKNSTKNTQTIRYLEWSKVSPFYED